MKKNKIDWVQFWEDVFKRMSITLIILVMWLVTAIYSFTIFFMQYVSWNLGLPYFLWSQIVGSYLILLWCYLILLWCVFLLPYYKTLHTLMKEGGKKGNARTSTRRR